MSLPDVPLPRDVVVVEDSKVEVRSLSRAEVTKMSGLDYDAAENWIVSCGAEVDAEEAARWRQSVGPDVAGIVIDRICELSGLVEGARKSG